MCTCVVATGPQGWWAEVRPAPGLARGADGVEKQVVELLISKLEQVDRRGVPAEGEVLPIGRVHDLRAHRGAGVLRGQAVVAQRQQPCACSGVMRTDCHTDSQGLTRFPRFPLCVPGPHTPLLSSALCACCATVQAGYAQANGQRAVGTPQRGGWCEGGQHCARAHRKAHGQGGSH